MDQQLGWMLEHGGLDWAAARTADSASRLYAWAEASAFGTPYVPDPADRSHVVGTIDLEGVEASAISAVLLEHGIVDRKSVV